MRTFEPPKEPDIVLTSDQCRVLIAWNPRAGGGSRRRTVKRLQETLADKGFSCFTSTDLSEVSELAHLWWEKGDLRILLGSGGDGTVRALAELSPVGTPIAVFPAGTANLLSKYLWHRRRVSAETLADAIAVGHACRFDAGTANGRLFVLMCSCGLDAAVVDKLHRNRKGHIGYGSYLKPLFQTCREYDYPELLIYCSEVAEDPSSVEKPRSTRWAFAFNFPCYAVGSGFARDAEPTDGILDVCAFDKPGFRSGFDFYCRAVLMGRSVEGQKRMQTRRLKITSERPVSFQVDGDPGGSLPVEIEAAPKRLTLLVPPLS